MTLLWHRRGLVAATAAAAFAARAARAQTVVVPPGSTVVVPPSGGTVIGPAGSTRNVADTLAALGDFDRFLELVQRAGLTDTLRGAGPFTVFAPNAAAFRAAPSAMLQDLLGTSNQAGSGGSLSGGSPDPVRLPALVRYHIVEGVALTSNQFGGDRRVQVGNGGELLVRNDGGVLTVRNPAPGMPSSGMGAAGSNIMPPAHIVRPDVLCSNGVVQVIDQVLFP